MKNIFVKLEERNTDDVTVASVHTLGEATAWVAYACGYMDASGLGGEIRASIHDGRIDICCSNKYANEMIQAGLL